MRKTTITEKKNYECAYCANSKQKGDYCQFSECPYKKEFEKLKTKK